MAAQESFYPIGFGRVSKIWSEIITNEEADIALMHSYALHASVIKAYSICSLQGCRRSQLCDSVPGFQAPLFRVLQVFRKIAACQRVQGQLFDFFGAEVTLSAEACKRAGFGCSGLESREKVLPIHFVFARALRL